MSEPTVEELQAKIASDIEAALTNAMIGTQSLTYCQDTVELIKKAVINTYGQVPPPPLRYEFEYNQAG